MTVILLLTYPKTLDNISILALLALNEMTDMTDVVRVVWFLYPKFQVSSVQTLVPPQQQYDIGVTETDDLRRHLQEIILREDRF